MTRANDSIWNQGLSDTEIVEALIAEGFAPWQAGQVLAAHYGESFRDVAAVDADTPPLILEEESRG